MDGGWDVVLADSLQVVVGAVLLVAAVTKLPRPGRFVEAVRGYEVIPAGLARPVAVAVLAAETAAGLALLTGWAVSAALVVALVLFAAFSAAVGVALRRGATVTCGCFGSADEQVSSRTLVRLGLLLATTTGALVVRAVSGADALDLAVLVDEGVDGVERLVATLALGASLVVGGAWSLHVRELVTLLADIRVVRKGN
jgi:Methylamine utilisation protein MauE